MTKKAKPTANLQAESIMRQVLDENEVGYLVSRFLEHVWRMRHHPTYPKAAA